jgi:hypothetical protein
MATATKRKAPMSIQHAAEQRALREEILASLVADDRRPTADEAFVLQQHGISGDRLRSELSRVRQLIRARQIAGTRQDRDELAQHVTEAQNKLEADGLAIQQKLEELQKQLSRLERDASQSAKRLEEATEAAKLLPQLLPPDIRQEIEHRRQAVEESVGLELRSLRIDLGELEQILAGPPNDINRQGLWMDMAERFNRDFIVATVQGASLTRRVSHEFNAARPKLEQQAGELRKQIQALQVAYETELAAVEAEVQEIIEGNHQ